MVVRKIFQNNNKLLLKKLNNEVLLWDIMTVFNGDTMYNMPKLSKIRVELILPFKSKSDMNIIKSLYFMNYISMDSVVKVNRFKKGLLNFFKFSFLLRGLDMYSFIYFVKNVVIPTIKKRKLYLKFNSEENIFNINFKDISDLKDLNLFFDYFNWENLVYIKIYSSRSSKKAETKLVIKETQKFFSNYFNKLF